MSRSIGIISSTCIVRCADDGCLASECLYTSDRAEAATTAKELGWRLVDSQWLCPDCAPSSRRTRRAGKAGAA
jgi:rubredoxin